MKKLHKLLTVLLTVILVLECFTVPALATETELETVPEETTISEPEVPAESEEAPQEPTEPETTPQKPTEPETTPQEPSISVEPIAVPEEALATIQSKVFNTVVAQESDDTEEPLDVTIISSGTCGKNAIWTYDSTGQLTISGEGAMYDYDPYDRPDWREFGFPSIKHIVIEPGITYIGSYSFYLLRTPSIEIAGTVKTIGKYAFGTSELESVVLPEGLITIGEGAFDGCYRLKSVSLPSTLKTIKLYAFANSALLEIVIPDNVTSIERSAFYYCDRLKAAYISRGISTINKCTFQFCDKLQYIFMPEKVTSIKAQAFQDCDDLSAVYYLGTKSQFKKIEISSSYNDALFNADWYLVTIATKHPKDVSTSEGGTVKFTAATNRSNVKYQWFYLAPDAEDWQVCSGSSAKKSTYSFTAKEELNGYLYCCLMTDTYGNQCSSNSATLTVVPAPKITKQPESAMAKIGKNVSVTVEAEGEGLTYLWYYANKGSTSFKKTSNTTNTYTIEMTSSRDGRKLYCLVKDKYGQSVKSETVTIYRETTPIVITQQPESVNAKYGEKVTLSVDATGDGLTYLWYYAAAGTTKSSKTSTKTNTYSTTMNVSRDGWKMYCLITDEYGKTLKTDTVTLTLERTPFNLIKAPEDVTVKYGEKAELSLEAEGDGLTYTWYYTKAGEKKFTKASTTGNTYSVTMKKSQDGRKVYCIVKDAYGKKIKTDAVVLKIDRTPLALAKAPEDVVVKSGKKAEISVLAEGDGLTYTWYYTKAGEKKFTKASTTGNTYSVTMKKSLNGRKVYCVIKDAYGKKIKTDTVTIRIDTSNS